MVIDYSRWDSINSDSEDESPFDPKKVKWGKVNGQWFEGDIAHTRKKTPQFLFNATAGESQWLSKKDLRAEMPASFKEQHKNNMLKKMADELQRKKRLEASVQKSASNSKESLAQKNEPAPPVEDIKMEADPRNKISIAMLHAVEAQKQKIAELEAQLHHEKEKLKKMVGLVTAQTSFQSPEPNPSVNVKPPPYDDILKDKPTPENPKSESAAPIVPDPTPSDSLERELVDEQLEREKRLEDKFQKMRDTLGLEHTQTLDTFFDLFDVWIGLYRLNKCSEVLEKILPICRKKGDPYELKAVQASAFTLWKQSRFQEALVLFHQMEVMVGPNPALCENIGHTYNSMGNYEKAEEYFTKAKERMENSITPMSGNLGGVLLGLGLVKERLKREKEALPLLKQALDLYQNKYKNPSSLVAKAHMSVGGCLMKLNSTDAEHHFREAIRIFKITCGHDSPLISNAMQKLATYLVSKQRFKEAHPYVLEALKIEGIKDAFNLTTCCELLQLSQMINSKINQNKNPHNNLKTLKSFYRPYVNLIKQINKRIQSSNFVEKDISTTAVWFKWGGEHCAIAQANETAAKMLKKAVELFRGVTEVDVSKLLEECQAVLQVVKKKVRKGKSNIKL